MKADEKTYKGRISSYDSNKHFGFIETEDDKAYFFFIDVAEEKRLKRTGVIKKNHKFSFGDEVEFKLRPSAKDISKNEAYDVHFMRNQRMQQLVDESEAIGAMSGYLKRINADYFIKHLNTYSIIPIQISEWEIDFDSVYTQRINKLVKFRLSKATRLDKLLAVLIDRKFCEEYYQVLELLDLDNTTEALITGKNSYGLFATILDGKIDAFIPLPKKPTQSEIEKFELFEKGQNVQVKVKFFNYNKLVTVSLAE